jgi:hypothetical protein
VKRWQGANFTAGAVFGRKHYDGRSQPQVVDLGNRRRAFGEVCATAKTRVALGSRALTLGMSALAGANFTAGGAEQGECT